MNQYDLEKGLQLRKKIFLIGYKGGMAHLASCFSAVDIIYTLYMKGVMKHDSTNSQMPDRDRFVLSKGHAGLALYSVLCEAGYITDEELATYLQPYCHIGGEPCMRDLDCIEATTGALGHGLSMAVGLAMAQKLDGTGARTFAMIGDGESQEGSIWEAAMSAASFNLDNLIAILDCNELQKTDRVDRIMKTTKWREKWESFGWNVVEVNGHDTDELFEVLSKKNDSLFPTLVIAHTIKGKGVSIMENNPIWHFKLPNKKELKIFIEELGISDEELV